MEIDVAARLRRLAHHLAASKQYRAAALALNAAATSSRSSLAPAERASLLVLAARQLDRAGGTGDRVRALSLLRRADALLADSRGAAAARLEVAAIREAVCGSGGAALRAERASAIADGLRVVREREGELRDAWDWWVFFKGRHAASLGAAGAAVAVDAAAECVRAGDATAAAAFELMAAQAWLGVDRPAGGAEIGSAALARAHKLLRTREDGKDQALLRFCCSVLGGLSRLRLGDVVGAREWGVEVAAGYDRLQATEGGTASRGGQWKWLPGKVLRTLAHHIQAGSCRGVGDGMLSWRHARDALRHAGMLAGGVAGHLEPVLFGGRLTAHAENALGVVLLESAARVRLERVELGEAAPLIHSGLQLTIGRPGTERTMRGHASQAAVYLLAAEWYMLKGTVEGAKLAENYLKQITDAARSSPAMNKALCDVAQMARTQRSLLTGEKRLEGIGGGALAQLDSSESKEYVSGAVRAAALFAEGVHALRDLKVLDAKAALLAARVPVCSGGAAVNEQLAANVCTNLASLFLSYQNITENFDEMLATARHAADTSEDLITRERSLRMQRKLVARSDDVDLSILAEMKAKLQENSLLLAERRRSIDQL